MTLDDATIYSIRAVAAAAKPARKELQRLAKLCGIKANQKNTVILEELEKLVAAATAKGHTAAGTLKTLLRLDGASEAARKAGAALVAASRSRDAKTVKEILATAPEGSSPQAVNWLGYYKGTGRRGDQSSKSTRMERFLDARL